MEKSKHTPGKWEIKELGGDEKAYTVYSDKSDKNHIAEVNRLHHFGAHQNLYDTESAIETKANASLIASAPEMLEMLKELQDVFKMKDSLTQAPGTSMGTIINDKLDNLITKAEGK